MSSAQPKQRYSWVRFFLVFVALNYFGRSLDEVFPEAARVALVMGIAIWLARRAPTWEEEAAELTRRPYGEHAESMVPPLEIIQTAAVALGQARAALADERAQHTPQAGRASVPAPLILSVRGVKARPTEDDERSLRMIIGRDG